MKLPLPKAGSTGLPRRHFKFTILSGIVVLTAFAVAIAAPTLIGIPLDPVDIPVLVGAMLGGAFLIALLPYWPMAVVGAALIWVVVPLYAEHPASPSMILAMATAAFGVLIAPSFQIADHWEKVVVLRLGRFKRVFGPGPRVIMPVVDRLVRFTDMRIRVTDFSAEKSITRDTVPVHVDALAFWLVWDAEKAMLEVENYIDAVTLSAQTALRDAIGRNDLATLLSERERLGSEIQTALDKKTNPWGVSILSIELKEVLIPKELEDALSRKAQAERERQSRVILGSAEVEIAKKFEEASATYEKNPTAFQLRAMNMAYDSIRRNKNIVLLPSSALDSINLGTTLGAASLAKRNMETEESQEEERDD